MRIKITDEQPQEAQFMTWQTLAQKIAPHGGHITLFEVSEHGINYFVAKPTLSGENGK